MCKFCNAVGEEGADCGFIEKSGALKESVDLDVGTMRGKIQYKREIRAFLNMFREAEVDFVVDGGFYGPTIIDCKVNFNYCPMCGCDLRKKSMEG